MKENLKIRSGAEGFAFQIDLSCQQFKPIPSHHHDELEVNLVLSGKANYLFGQRRVPLLAGSMIWLFPRQEHVLMDWSHDFSMWVVVFRPDLVKLHTEPVDRRILRSPDPGDIFCRQIDLRTADFLSHVYRDAGIEVHDLEFINAALGYALVASWRAFDLSHESLPYADVHPSVAKAARLIGRADASISLKHLARDAGLSPARLSRLFKQQTGITLTAFRQRECLKRFLRLYCTGARYSLIEAAFLAGFGSYPQFHRIFRKIMLISPADYKKNMGKLQKQAALG